MAGIKQLFAADPYAARQREKLDYFLPEGYESIEEVDATCLDMLSTGRLSIVGETVVRQSMRTVKDQALSMMLFQQYSNRMLAALTKDATRLSPPGKRKAAISIRAGAAFQPYINNFMPGTPIGFLTQARDHETATPNSIGESKLGSFEGKHAIIFDPMLATGGSMADMIDAVLERGAERITTVSAFSAPQGIARVAMYDQVVRIISAPLEAGLNEKGYIVGGHQPHSMLGDFGDRYFGPIE